MASFIALINSGSTGTVIQNNVFTSIINLFATGSAGSLSQFGGIM